MDLGFDFFRLFLGAACVVGVCHLFELANYENEDGKKDAAMDEIELAKLRGKMTRTALMDKDESHKHFLDWASRKENGEMMLLNVVVQIAAF